VQSRNVGTYGYVFVDSTLSTDGTAPGATMLARIEGDRFPNSNVAYVNCKMGPQIAAKGWLITNSTGMPVASLDLSTLKFWEYQSTDLNGAALDVSMRDPASRQITEAEAAALRDKATVLAGWNPAP
jgi:pectin methylesterase-like acyl-CoA thioesterase